MIMIKRWNMAHLGSKDSLLTFAFMADVYFHNNGHTLFDLAKK